MGFISNGWNIKNSKLTYPPGLDKRQVFRFVHEAIYDGHLPVMRAIGYSLQTPLKGSSASSPKVLKRFQNCAEDKMTLVANFSKLLFIIEPTVKRVSIEEMTGMVTTQTAQFLVSAQPALVLSTQDYLFTALDEVSAELAVSCGTGFVSADVNYEKIRKANRATAKTRLFPIYSYHCIIDFVNVLPRVEDGVVYLKYYHNMTDEILISLFERLFNTLSDREWCRGYQELCLG